MCYMTNCVHPSIVLEALSQPCNDNELVRKRFLGIQANTSPLSYAELDGAKDLHTSNPEKFANEMRKLQMNKGLKIFGGCCGTDKLFCYIIFFTSFRAMRQNSIAREEITIKERMVMCQPYSLLTYAIPNEEMELPM